MLRFFKDLGTTLPRTGPVRERALRSLYKKFSVVLVAVEKHLSDVQKEKLANYSFC